MILNLIQSLIYSSLILLSFIMISNPLKVNKKANFWFGVFLFFLSSYWFDEIIYLISEKSFGIKLKFAFRWLQFFTPILLYISIKFFTNAKYKPNLRWLLYLIVPAIFLVLIIIRKELKQFQEIYLGLVWAHSLFYFLICIYEIRKHKKRIVLFSSDAYEISLDWLEYIFISLSIMIIFIAVFNFTNSDEPLNLYINIIVFITVYFVAYNALKQKEIFPTNARHRSEVMSLNKTDGVDVKRKIVSDERLIELKLQLEKLMEIQEPHLNCDINLIGLSELLKISPHQLSYVINQGFNQNFFQFINNFRVEEAKKLLNNYTDQKLSIIGIGFESGFSSKSAFYNTFKKTTGFTPSEFKKRSPRL